MVLMSQFVTDSVTGDEVMRNFKPGNIAKDFIKEKFAFCYSMQLP